MHHLFLRAAKVQPESGQGDRSASRAGRGRSQHAGARGAGGAVPAVPLETEKEQLRAAQLESPAAERCGDAPQAGQGNTFLASSCSSRPRDPTPGATGAMGSGQESHKTPEEARGCGVGRQALDEGGVQLARFMVIAGTSLKELLDQGGFLLLQLGDAFTLVGHLLHGTEEENAA